MQLRRTWSVISSAKLLTLLTSLLAAAPVGVLHSAEEPPDAKLVRDEVSKHWQIALELARSVQASYELKEVDHYAGGSPSMHLRGEVRSAASFHLESFELLMPTKQWPGLSRIGHSGVHGLNSKYQFELRKRWDGAEWALKRVEMLPGLGKQFRSVDSRMERSVLFQHFGAPIGPFVTVIQENQCRLTSVQRLADNPALVRVEFNTGRTPLGSGLEGWVLLDSDALWCVKECQITRQIQNTHRLLITGRNTYQRTKDGFPMPIRVVRRTAAYENGKMLYDCEETLSYSCRIDNAVPEHDFSLTAFGLPEPGGIQFDKPRAYLWFYLAGAACLVSALGLGWFLRRSTRRGHD